MVFGIKTNSDYCTDRLCTHWGWGKGVAWATPTIQINAFRLGPKSYLSKLNHHLGTA